MNRLVSLLLAVLVLGTASSASAGGFYLTDRGAVPLGRGTAYVAGGRDPQAIWYNPANLAWSGRQLLIDGSMTFFNGSYTRVDSGGNTLPTVDVGAPPIPIPMIAYSDDFGLDKWTFGAAVFAPNAVLLNWPTTVGSGGNEEPAPQRYSLYNMKGTAVAYLALAAAWRPTPRLAIGISPELIVGRFDATVAMSACDGTICSQPEDPDYDGVAQFEAFPIIRATANLGITYDAGKVRLGASAVLPFNLSGNGTFDVRLPPAAMFQGAYVDGNSMSFDMPFPWILRTGIEVRPIRNLAIETAFVIEGWKRQKTVDLTPHDVWIRNVTGIGNYEVGPVSIDRSMHNTYSIRLGIEYGGLFGGKITLRAGGFYETTGFDNAHLQALTLDAWKVYIGAGGSWQVKPGLYLDGAIGHLFMNDPNVTNSVIAQPTALRPERNGSSPTQGGPAIIGNGQYNMEATMIMGGLRWRFDRARSAPAAGGSPAPAAGGAPGAQPTPGEPTPATDPGTPTPAPAG